MFKFFFFRNCAVYYTMWKNIAEPGRKIWRVLIACWIPKITKTHSDYVIFLAFPLQQKLHERALVLR